MAIFYPGSHKLLFPMKRSKSNSDRLLDPPRYTEYERMRPIMLYLPEAWLRAVNNYCGRHRNLWIRELIKRSLRNAGYKIEGSVDSLERRRIHRARRKRKRRGGRSVRAALRRERKLEADRRARQARFQFTSDNTILSTDLNGTLAGFIYSDGGLAQEARHSEETLLYELRCWYKQDKPMTDAQLLCVHRYEGHADVTGSTSIDSTQLSWWHLE